MSSKSSRKRAAIEESVRLSELKAKAEEKPAREVYRSASKQNMHQKAVTNLGDALKGVWTVYKDQFLGDDK